MFVLTVDQVGSSGDKDRIPDLFALVDGLEGSGAPLRPFQRTAGDEAQAVFDDPAAALVIALALVRTGHWYVGIGEGSVSVPLPAETRAGTGPAFEQARRAVERAKKTKGRCCFAGSVSAAQLVDRALSLLARLEIDRQETRQQAGEMARQGLSQKQIAEKLGISQSAVSQRLSEGYWSETRALIDELVEILR